MNRISATELLRPANNAFERGPVEDNPWFTLLHLENNNSALLTDQRHRLENQKIWNTWQCYLANEGLTKNSKRQEIPMQYRTPYDSKSIKYIVDKVKERHPSTPDVIDTIHDSHINFSGALIENDIYFENMVFLQSISFNDCFVDSSIIIDKSVFLESFTCSKSKIASRFMIMQSSFNRGLFMQGSDINRANIRDANMNANLNISRSRFSGVLEIEKTRVSGSFHAMDIITNSPIILTNCDFQRKLDLSGSKSSHSVSFHDCSVNSEAVFSSSKTDEIIFNACTLKSDINFSSSLNAHRQGFYEGPIKTQFLTFPPAFISTDVNSDLDFSDVIWPKVPRDFDRAKRSRTLYRKLRRISGASKDFETEHFLLSMEFRCREASSNSVFESMALYLYRVLSSFGWSIDRPLFFLISVWLIGAALIGVIEWADACLGYEQYSCLETGHVEANGPRKFPELHLSLGQSLALGLSNTFGFLGLGWHIMRDELSSLTGASELVAVCQMILGPIALFLLLVALRNQFRLK